MDALAGLALDLAFANKYEGRPACDINIKD